jgi:hypothetical protein
MEEWQPSTLMVSGQVSTEDMLRQICSMRAGLSSSDDPAPLPAHARRGSQQSYPKCCLRCKAARLHRCSS